MHGERAIASESTHRDSMRVLVGVVALTVIQATTSTSTRAMVVPTRTRATVMAVICAWGRVLSLSLTPPRVFGLGARLLRCSDIATSPAPHARDPFMLHT